MLGRANPMVKTAHCLTHWEKASTKRAKLIPTKDAVDNPAMIYPGMILIIDHGEDKGHTGLVEKLEGALITTIEGNTNASKNREGIGVFRLTRKVVDINTGFIDYSGL